MPTTGRWSSALEVKGDLIRVVARVSAMPRHDDVTNGVCAGLVEGYAFLPTDRTVRVGLRDPGGHVGKSLFTQNCSEDIAASRIQACAAAACSVLSVAQNP